MTESSEESLEWTRWKLAKDLKTVEMAMIKSTVNESTKFYQDGDYRNAYKTLWSGIQHAGLLDEYFRYSVEEDND